VEQIEPVILGYIPVHAHIYVENGA